MTSTEIERAADVATEGQTALMLWAQDVAAAYSVAVKLCQTSFVPPTLRSKPEEAAAAILTGAEVGLSPMAALRSIDIISGTPAMRANTMRGLVQSRGHEVWVEHASPERAVVKGRRRGEENVQESVWDLARAQGLNLLTRDNWKKQPQAMLVARATAELCRLVGSDVILGLPYSQEELEDGTEGEAAPQSTKKVRRRLAVAAPEPSLSEPESPQEPVEAEPATTEPELSPEPAWPAVAEPGAVGE